MDEEDEIPIIIPEPGASTECKSTLCHISKVCTQTPFNAFGLLETMRKIWKPTNGMTAKELKQNLFSFQFHHERDMEKILFMEPWHYDKNVLVLKRLDSGTQPSALKFNTLPFWIRIYDLPIIRRQEAVLQAIGNRCGKYLEVDLKTLDGVDRSIRIKIQLDTMKPLKQRTKIIIGNGQAIWIQIRYER
ncbi:hypothetical protein DH2020_047271 [Rehmannia glutinosa]|uniref:DUF4283 domain-containing protein n=1 Tax=Rehmannia glutinosa TaxID=99300 RepID=A0ABR0U906_REHGL